MARSHWYLVALATIGGVTACAPADIPLPTESQKERGLICVAETTGKAATRPLTENLAVEVYVDGSGSMLGYVKGSNEGQTAYGETIELISEVFEQTDGYQVSYHRIEDGGNRELARSQYRDAQQPLFYGSPQYPNVTSPIDAAIVPPADGENKLTVIVSDLEINDADTTGLSAKINRYYSSDRQDHAVGIWAQRSEFQGNIYLSQQIFLSSFLYSTEGRSPEDYRPFYVIFIGPYNDIATFFERVNRNAPQLLETGELTIFSPNHLVESLSFLQDLAAVKLPTTMTRPQQPSLSDGKVVVSAATPPYELLEISPDQAADSTINYSLPLTLAPHSLAPSGFTATVEAEAYDEFEKGFSSKPSDPQLESLSPKLKNAVSADNWQISDDGKQLNLSLTLRPSQLELPGLYLFTVTLMAQDLAEPSWWEAWDRSRSHGNDGAKTQGIQRLMRNLRERTLTLQKASGSVPLGRLCYAIHKQ